MINIAICDDDALSRQIVQDLLSDYSKPYSGDFHIESFGSSFELFSAVEKGGPFDIYLLDVIMPLENGMQLAKRLREAGARGKIIFVTATNDYVMDSFSVRAFHYLMKPLDRDAMFAVLDDCVAELRRENAVTVEIKARDGYHRISPDSIQYVESVNRALIYHMEGTGDITSTTVRISFQDAVAALCSDKRFALAGSSLLVNLRKIDAMDRGYIRLTDGNVLYPPERAFPALRNAWKALG